MALYEMNLYHLSTRILNEFVEFVGDEKNIADFMKILDVLILRP